MKTTHGAWFMLIAACVPTFGCSDPCLGKEGDDRAQCEAEQAAKASGGGGSNDAVHAGSGGGGGASSNEHIDDLPTGCTQLGTLDASAEVTGWLKFFFDSNDDHQDFYCFTVPESNISSVAVSLKAGAPKIYKYADALSDADAIPASTSATNSWDLPPGDYALQIFRGPGQDNGTTYEGVVTRSDLGISQTEAGPDETPALATELVVHAAISKVEGYVGKLDEYDVYRLTVPSGRTLDLALTNAGTTGPVDVSAAPYANLAPVYAAPIISAPADSNQLAKPAALASGDHLLRVSGTGAYRLEFSLTAQTTGEAGGGSE